MTFLPEKISLVDAKALRRIYTIGAAWPVCSTLKYFTLIGQNLSCDLQHPIIMLRGEQLICSENLAYDWVLNSDHLSRRWAHWPIDDQFKAVIFKNTSVYNKLT